jgi:hypothetical protein
MLAELLFSFEDVLTRFCVKAGKFSVTCRLIKVSRDLISFFVQCASEAV